MTSASHGLSVTAIALAVGLGCMFVAGCGGSSRDAGCGTGEPGERIDLHNSGIQCEEANALINILPNIKRPQEVRSDSEVWMCTYLRARYLPVRIRCSQGKRFFTLVDTD